MPDLPGIVAAAHAAGARVYVDAVHAAPHRRLDVEALGCDALACSAYKWFGPHVGILWGRPELLAELEPDKVRPSSDEVPDRWELGTLPFEQLAGVRAAADYVLSADWDAVRAHEDVAARGRARRPRRDVARDALRRRAATARPRSCSRSPAARPDEVATALAARQVAVWHGNYYAWELERLLGLEPHGAIRAGFVHYNAEADAERLLAAVADLAYVRTSTAA